VWETYLVPRQEGDPTLGPQGMMPASAITTWQNPPDVPISGGGTWSSYTLDRWTRLRAGSTYLLAIRRPILCSAYAREMTCLQTPSWFWMR
jgi:hypothetical protein